ncbi:hypothetical protein [Streptomyces sp. NRRL S-1896]|uniref:hypothetical protein n=1 Tax=Streptomyces sp. NRRL S-1896 TaxID=1463893 RepID=UPI00131ADA19|nr:hypothetical protein [Streptomyces sp. NRRL S-1896]
MESTRNLQLSAVWTGWLWVNPVDGDPHTTIADRYLGSRLVGDERRAVREWVFPFALTIWP